MHILQEQLAKRAKVRNNPPRVSGSGLIVVLGVKAMLKAFSLWADRALGVLPGWGLPIVLLALAVGLQWVAMGLSLHMAGWLRWLALRLQQARQRRARSLAVESFRSAC